MATMSNRCSMRPDDPSRPESAIVDRPQRANRTVQVVGQPPPTSAEPMNKANITGNGTSVRLVGGFDASTENVDGVRGRKAQRRDHPDQLASVLERLGHHRVREHGEDRTCSERENEADRFG